VLYFRAKPHLHNKKKESEHSFLPSWWIHTSSAMYVSWIFLSFTSFVFSFQSLHVDHHSPHSPITTTTTKGLIPPLRYPPNQFWTVCPLPTSRHRRCEYHSQLLDVGINCALASLLPTSCRLGIGHPLPRRCSTPNSNHPIHCT